MNSYKLIIRSSDLGVEINTSDSELYPKSTYWNRTVQNRRRWVHNRELKINNSKLARADLIELGISSEKLDQLAKATHIEIEIGFVNEDFGYAARIFPWEFVLSAATKSRKNASKIVTRYLKRKATKRLPKPPNSFLFIQSTPGNFRNSYSFDTEIGALKSIVTSDQGSNKWQFEKVVDPDLTALANNISQFKPDILHLTGVDSYEGWQLLDAGAPKPSSDGFYLSDEANREYLCEFPELANALNSFSGRQKFLTTFNCFYSAPRMAAMVVANGTRFSIGVQDEINNAVLENFYDSFYRALKNRPFEILQAFIQSMKLLQSEPSDLAGTGIVLWSHKALISPRANKVELTKTISLAEIRPPRLELKPGESIRDFVDVKIETVGEINYSMLHNGRSIFKKFKLHPTEYVTIDDIDIEVQFQLGGEKFTYKSTIEISRKRELENMIQIPLTWEFAKSLRETIVSAILVKLSHHNKILYQVTHKIRLNPLNEWMDNERDGGWLPSFVLPRDPAVQDIVELARRNLVTLTGDVSARFDGYQSGNAEAVDIQCRALWSALSFDNDIGYIEPPPSYTNNVQRLRTPSQVIENRQGTCIDLCLFFAACLEYIGIHPVIFLTSGHSFPGYWRDWQAHANFTLKEIAGPKSQENAAETGQNSSTHYIKNRNAEDRTFEYRTGQFEEIALEVDQGNLIPLETTLITQRASFSSAIDEGIGNLSHIRGFDAMQDIKQARISGVTPLPIRGPVN